MTAVKRCFLTFLMIAAPLATGGAAAGPVEEYASEYDKLTRKAEKVWKMAKEHHPEQVGGTTKIQLEILHISGRISAFGTRVRTYHQGILKAQAEANPERVARGDERLVLMTLATGTLSGAFDQLSAYFEIKRNEYLQTANKTRGAWKTLQKLWSSTLSPHGANAASRGPRKPKS